VRAGGDAGGRACGGRHDRQLPAAAAGAHAGRRRRGSRAGDGTAPRGPALYVAPDAARQPGGYGRGDDMTAMISDSSAGARGRMTPPGRQAGAEVVRGREAEQKMIRELLRRAQRGAGGVVLVDGEPGVGKSLLLRDATDEAAEH